MTRQTAARRAQRQRTHLASPRRCPGLRRRACPVPPDAVHEFGLALLAETLAWEEVRAVRALFPGDGEAEGMALRAWTIAARRLTEAAGYSAGL